ncbi:MAG: ATP synthase F1 subunit delta [Deltaproteobacteria bacterium]|nr:ATP synthase F1 subunit delta [Deltaproteobacteria bacterium]
MSSVVSRRYAKALIDLATQEGIADQVEKEFGTIVKTVVENRKLKNFFFNPVFNNEDKGKLLDMVVDEIRVSGLLKRFLRLLIGKDRFPIIREIYREYVRFADEIHNRAKAEVTTALPLKEEDKKNLQAKLEALSGKRIYLKVKEDPALIGGAVTRIGSVVYDGSIKSSMIKLKEQLVKG